MINYNNFNNKYFGEKYSGGDIELPKYRNELKNFILSLPKDAKILDAGCGKGKFIRVVNMYRSDIKVFAIDITDTSLFLPDKTDFKIGDVENLTKYYQKNSFDAILSIHVIEHLLFPTAMVNSFFDLLKTGGRVYIETPNWIRVFLPFFDIWFWSDYTHLRPFSKFTISRLLNESNFKINKLCTISSASFFIKRNNVSEKKEVTNFNDKYVYKNGLFLKVLAKLSKPFIKDILIAIAEK